MSLRRALVVEDDANIRQMLGLILACEGWDVLQREDATTVLDDATGVDLVLLDLMLPGKSGQEALHELRQSPKHADTPVVIVSATLMPGEASSGALLGADASVAKPFDPDVLIRRCERAIASRAEGAWQPA